MHKYSIQIAWSREDEAFLADVPELPGCMADGATREEALANICVAIEEWLETAKLDKRKIPQAFSLQDWEDNRARFQAQLHQEIEQKVKALVAKIVEQMQPINVVLSNEPLASRQRFDPRFLSPTVKAQ